MSSRVTKLKKIERMGNIVRIARLTVDQGLRDAVAKAAARASQSQTGYVLGALLSRLEADGYDVDDYVNSAGE